MQGPPPVTAASVKSDGAVVGTPVSKIGAVGKSVQLLVHAGARAVPVAVLVLLFGTLTLDSEMLLIALVAIGSVPPAPTEAPAPAVDVAPAPGRSLTWLPPRNSRLPRKSPTIQSPRLPSKNSSKNLISALARRAPYSTDSRPQESGTLKVGSTSAFPPPVPGARGGNLA